MTPYIAEKLEHTAMEMVVQAIMDYRNQAERIFTRKVT